MKKGLLIFIITTTLIFQLVKADIGIGIRWSIEEIFINDLQEGCLSYSIYNPFDTDVTATISVSEELQNYVSSIEPNQVFIPAYEGDPNDNAAKLANSKQVKVCFYGKVWRWPPFHPVDYKGGILASSSPGNVVGVTGSVVASVVHAPLTLRVGDISNYYKFIVVLIITVVLVVIAILKVIKKLPKRKRKYCSKCQKSYSARIKFCPGCGKELG